MMVEIAAGRARAINSLALGGRLCWTALASLPQSIIAIIALAIARYYIIAIMLIAGFFVGLWWHILWACFWCVAKKKKSC